MPSILAVDIGTTSAKALVITSQGKVLASARASYPTHRPTPDRSEQNASQILVAIRKIIASAAASVNGQVDGISFSGAMHSIMAVDSNGNALTPLMTWADLRAKEEASAIKTSGGQQVYEVTGTPVHPMSPLCKIRWMKTHEPAIFQQTYKYIGIKEYVWYQLLGEFAIDHSLASATGLFDNKSLTWSSLALSLAGIDASKLSSPVSVYKKFFSGPSSTSLGLPANVPWIIGGSDGCLANLGSNAMSGDVISVTIGTSGAVRKTVAAYHPDPTGRTFHYLLDESTFVTGGATNNGAVLIQWFAEKFLKEKTDLVSFCERASKIAPGADGLLFLPYVLGERAPVYDPDAAGVFLGVRHHHTSEHFMRAILEGIGFALASISENVQENEGPFHRIIASGGFVVSPPWVQLMADIFGREVLVQSSDDASALGAAQIGFKSIGESTSFTFPMEKLYQPDPRTHALYRACYQIYKNLYSHISDDLHALTRTAH